MVVLDDVATESTPSVCLPSVRASPAYRKGDDVFVFYRMGKRCVPSRKYIAVLDRRHGAYRPRTGLSEGWVPARVALDQVVSEEPDSKAGDICIEYSWPYFFSQHGHMADSVDQDGDTWTEWYLAADVIPAVRGCDAHSPPGFGFVLPGSQPELAIVAFRWGGRNQILSCDQWGDSGSPISDKFIESFLKITVVPKLRHNYEVWTVYIEDHSDMAKLADSAHLFFGKQHPLHRARHVCAMYFLWPTPFEENCIPTRETGTDDGAALLDQKSFFCLMKAVERAGLPTRFPHASGFYELLASKRWTHILSTVPHLRVPPTVSVPRMLVERSCAEAAEHSLSALEELRRYQAELRKEPAPEGAICKGVAKLGFSWEALDVKFWELKAGLETALYELTKVISISQELTGQPHDCDSIIVQEYVKHDLELRAYVVEGEVEAVVYTKFCKIKPNREFGDFRELHVRDDAARQWMNGDLAALERGEEQCRELCKHWMAWARVQCCELPPAIRFDFFVARGDEPGQAVVWTLEICELGFSMLGERNLALKVFDAVLRSCLRGEASEDIRPPKRLRATLRD